MKQVLTFVFSICYLTIYSQNVGVNRTLPEYILDVRSTSISEPGILNISNPDKSRYLRLFSGSEMFPDPSMSWNPGHNLLFATYDEATFTFTEYLRISTSGDLGVGVVDPEARLDVRGGDWNLDAGNPGDLRIGNSTHNLRIGVATGGGGAGISRIYSSNRMQLGVDSSTTMTLDKDGETGFGTTNPSQKVDINGKLKIGNDATAPSEGTIRYDSESKTFQGYDGTKWINLGGSGPFGNSATINFPDASYSLSVLGEEITNIEADGNRIAVRSRNEVPSGIPNVSTFEIFLQLYEQQSPGGNWIQMLNLNSESVGSDRNFANSFVLKDDILLVGDPKNKSVTKYGPILFMGSPFWTSNQTYNSPNTSTNDLFGWSVAYDSGLTMIGAPEINIYSFPLPAVYGSGRAYIYDLTNTLQATLLGSGPQDGDGFGFSVDINQDRALVGAPFNHFGSIEDAGSVTVYNFFNNAWLQNTTFNNTTPETDEQYGIAVSVEDNDYLYMRGEIEGIDLYLIENGFWVLKETLSGNGQNPQILSHKTLGVDQLTYKNDPGRTNTTHLVVAERDNADFFQEVSYLSNGTSYIVDYDITFDRILTVDEVGNLCEFIK